MATEFLSRTEWITHDASPDLDEMRRMLEVAQNLNGRGQRMRVTLQIHAAHLRAYGRRGSVASGPPGTVSLYGSGATSRSGSGALGIEPRHLFGAIAANDGDMRAAMQQLANERPGVSARGVQWVEMHVFAVPK